MYVLEKSIIPMPRKLEDKKERIRIGAFASGEFTVVNESTEMLCAEGVSLLIKDINEKACATPTEGGYKITVKVDENATAFEGIDSDEAYYIDVTDEGAILCGKTDKGAFYACITAKRLIYTEGDSLYIHKAYILDYPGYKNRGLTIETRCGSDLMTLQDWLDAIDYVADIKCNLLGVGLYNCWGVQYDGVVSEYLYVPIKKYPFLKTPKISKFYSVKEKKWHYDTVLPPMFEEDFFGEVCAYAKKRNVKIRPRFASQSHNTLIPRLMPEIAPIRADGTRVEDCFCTSNPKTYEVLFNIYDEIIDRYLAPNGFTEIGVGLDEIPEVYKCQCDKCKDLTTYDILISHIIKVVSYLKSRGMTTVQLAHDMLFKHDDKFEDMKAKFTEAGIYDTLIIGWWAYHVGEEFFHKKADKVNNLMRGQIAPIAGYYHWAIPLENDENVRLCARKGMDLGFEGILSYSAIDKSGDKCFKALADVSWNTDRIDEPAEFYERYAYTLYPENTASAVRAFRSMNAIMEDETRQGYTPRILQFDFYIFGYKFANKEYPQNFPGGAFKYIRDDEAQYIPYLEYVFEKASGALEFFENSGSSSEINKVWTITAMQYKYRADEYLTIYRLDKEYNKGNVEPFTVIAELERLVAQKERLMALAEESRSPANAATYLRNLSAERQYMVDLIDYFKTEIKAGRRPKLDVLDLRYATGKTLRFLH